MNDLETRHLRYFVTVAEELHFGRAATRLGMAQPPLSKAIRDLERRLGVQLLIRTTRQVRLTPVGETFLADALVALDAVAVAARRARRAGQPEQRLRVALKADFDAELLPRIAEAYRAAPIALLLGGPGEQIPALRQDRADVALVLAPFDDRGIDREPLVTGPRVVALPAADPLAARETVELPDLAGRMLPTGLPAESGSILPPPRDGGRMMDLAQLFNLVEMGSIVWFLPDWVARRFPRPGIAYRPVPALPPATLEIAWRADSRSPAVAAFVSTAREIADRSSGDAV